MIISTRYFFISAGYFAVEEVGEHVFDIFHKKNMSLPDEQVPPTAVVPFRPFASIYTFCFSTPERERKTHAVVVFTLSQIHQLDPFLPRPIVVVLNFTLACVAIWINRDFEIVNRNTGRQSPDGV